MDLNTFASNVVQEHELFLMALNGEYLQSLTPGSKPSPADVVAFASSASATRNALNERVGAQAAELVSALEVGAQSAAKETMRGLLGDFQTEFARITMINVQTAIKALRVGRDELGKIFTSPMGGAMGSLLIKKLQKLDFKVPDTAGRKWDSQRLVLFAAREFAYRVTLTKQLDEIGSGLAEVFYPDHESDGVVFIAQGPARGTFPAYAELEKTVFHPNSKAQVVRHVTT